MIARIKAFYERPSVRFIAIGGANFILTYGAYLITWLITGNYRLSFFVALAIGVLFVTLANIHHAFRRKMRPLSLMVYGVYYLLYTWANYALLGVMIETWGVAPSIAPIAVMAVLVPVHFVLSKYLIVRITHPRPEAGA